VNMTPLSHLRNPQKFFGLPPSLWPICHITATPHPLSRPRKRDVFSNSAALGSRSIATQPIIFYGLPYQKPGVCARTHERPKGVQTAANRPAHLRWLALFSGPGVREAGDHRSDRAEKTIIRHPTARLIALPMGGRCQGNHKTRP